LALVGRADRHQIANAIIASPITVSIRLFELKRSGLVHNMKWSDGSRVWVLTQEGHRRREYYEQRERRERERRERGD